MRRFLFALAAQIALHSAAFATPTPDELRTLAYGHETARVEAAFAAARAKATPENQDYDLQRELMTAFATTDPRIDAFTRLWLNTDPNSPYAHTARAWHLWAMGWSMRGERQIQEIYPEAVQKFADLHGEALDHALIAWEIAPDFVAAADAVVRLSPTIGNKRNLQAYVAQIMAATPNYGTLTRAAWALSPSWGGSIAQVYDLCDSYAAVVKLDVAYSIATCRIDMIYRGGIYGEARDIARGALIANDSPVLEYARVDEATNGNGPPDDRIKVLAKYLGSGGATDTAAAEVFDYLVTATGGTLPAKFPETLANHLAWARDTLRHDPGNANMVFAYIRDQKNAHFLGGPKANPAEARRVLRALLRTAPYNIGAWLMLGGIEQYIGAQQHPGALQDPALGDDAFINAMVYSNHRSAYMDARIDARLPWFVQARSGGKDDAAGLATLEDVARFDTEIVCPLVRMIRLKQATCSAEEIPMPNCQTLLGVMDPNSDLIALGATALTDVLTDVERRKACGFERSAGIEALTFEPRQVPMGPDTN